MTVVAIETPIPVLLPTEVERCLLATERAYDAELHAVTELSFGNVVAVGGERPAVEIRRSVCDHVVRRLHFVVARLGHCWKLAENAFEGIEAVDTAATLAA